MNNNILNTLLSAISKSLNIASNILPIYKDTYPLIKKGKNFLNNKNSPKTKENLNTNNDKPNYDDNINNQKKNLSNNPKFFI